ncbi:hypothetical protein ACJIZ3_003369 [Penstemon smallii]|uniref:USP domain-containing protein n=1 Tax=Penstemon smallii TaxID=265156 RepID=A0ABD3UAM4_9LAMI
MEEVQELSRNSGIINIGNSCYAVALLQVLSSFPSFCHALHTHSTIGDCRNAGQQQDAHEFLGRLLDKLALCDVAGFDCNHITTANTNVREFYASFDSDDPYEVLNIKNNWEAYVARESGVVGQVNCDVCQTRQTMNVVNKLLVFPEVFTVFIVRYDDSIEKLDNPVEDEDDQLELEDKDGNLYQRVAVILHQGALMTEGHYIAAVKSRYKWFIYDDSIVRHSSTISGFKEESYLIFYRKVDIHVYSFFFYNLEKLRKREKYRKKREAKKIEVEKQKELRRAKRQSIASLMTLHGQGVEGNINALMLEKRPNYGINALREIHIYQKNCKLLIPLKAFQKVVRQIAEDHGIRRGYGDNLHASEFYLAELFQDSNLCAIHAKRVTLRASPVVYPSGSPN